jgi:hypothetical protein
MIYRKTPMVKNQMREPGDYHRLAAQGEALRNGWGGQQPQHARHKAIP